MPPSPRSPATPPSTPSEWLEAAWVSHLIQPALAAEQAGRAAEMAAAAGELHLQAEAWALRAYALAKIDPDVARLRPTLDALRAGIQDLQAGDEPIVCLLRDAEAYLETRLGHHQRALDLTLLNIAAERRRAPRAHCLSLLAASVTTMRLGRNDETIRWRFRHAEFAREAGLTREHATGLYNVGYWHWSQFNLDDALLHCGQARDIWADEIAPRLRSVNQMGLALIQGTAGQVDEAWRNVRLWLDQPGGPLRGPEEIRDWSANIAQAAVDVGEYELAETYLAMGSDPTIVTPRRPAQWHRARGNWLLAHGRPAEARQLCESFMHPSRRRFLADDPQTRLHLLEIIEQACAALGDVEGERRASRRVRSLLLPLVSRSARAQYVTLQVLRDAARPDAQAGPRDAQRLHLIEEVSQALAAGATAPARPVDDGAVRQVPAAIAEPPSPPVPSARMLAQVTHELRTPLHGVLGLTSLLLMTKLDDQQHRLAALTQQSAEQMLRIVNDILDVAKAEAGRLEIRPQAFDLRGLLTHVVGVFERERLSRPVQLHWQADDDVPLRIVGDPGRIGQVLLNFVANAMRATTQGEVRLQASMRRGLLRLAVHDTGFGIPAADQQRLFSPFGRSAAQPAQQGPVSSALAMQEGVGLGLSLCRQLAELLGAGLGFESTEGKGSVFWIDLPLKVGQAEVAAADV